MGAFKRFLLDGGQIGLPLSEVADESLAYFLACAIKEERAALARLVELVDEAQRRNLPDRQLLAALRKQL